MTKKKNILFLDFDGVLNSRRSFWKKYAEHFGVEWTDEDFDLKWYGKGNWENMNPDLWDRIDKAEKEKKKELGMPDIGMYKWPHEEPAIEALNTIVKENDAKVVVCSSWRHAYDIEGLQNVLNKWGAKCEVIGITPDVRRDYNSRGLEILSWIMDHHTEIKGICILDDDAAYDINNVLEKWAVQGISGDKFGLRHEHIREARRCFETRMDPFHDFQKWLPEDKLQEEMKKHGIWKEIPITPDQLDNIKNNPDYHFHYFTVRKGKARYTLLHLPDRSCGLYYALRESWDGLTGRRAIEPTDELICHVSLKNH